MQLQIFKLCKKLLAAINHLYEQFSKNQWHIPEIILTRDIKSLHFLALIVLQILAQTFPKFQSRKAE